MELQSAPEYDIPKELIWTTKDGRKIAIANMDTDHLTNLFLYLTRRGLWKAALKHCHYNPGSATNKQLVAVGKAIHTEYRFITRGVVPPQFPAICDELRLRKVNLRPLMAQSYDSYLTQLGNSVIAARLVNKSLSKYIMDHIDEFFV
jgi:hypothetical protein